MECRKKLFWCIRACKLSGLVDNPDSIANYLINDFFCFFPNKIVVVIHEADNGIRGFFDTLNQIWIEIKCGIIQPGQFDHSSRKKGRRRPFWAAPLPLIFEITLFVAGYPFLNLFGEYTLFDSNQSREKQEFFPIQKI